MGEHVNSPTFNVVAWLTTVAMIALTLVLVYTAIFPSLGGAALSFLKLHWGHWL
jgi:hypothetical protein